MDRQLAILKLVVSNDGRWSWYQLDRGLGSKGIAGGSWMIGAIRRLVEDGLIEEREGATPAQPLYFSTAKGRERVREIENPRPQPLVPRRRVAAKRQVAQGAST